MQTTQQANLKGDTHALGNSDAESFELIFTPNPTATNFSLEALSNSTKPINICVIDATGRVKTVINEVLL